MTVKNRFIHFKSKDNFLSENGVNNKVETPDSLPDIDGDVKYGNIKESSVVFIKDSKEIWTHGNLYKSVNWSVLKED